MAVDRRCPGSLVRAFREHCDDAPLGRVVTSLQRARCGGTVDRPLAEALEALGRVHYRASTRADGKRLRAKSW